MKKTILLLVITALFLGCTKEDEAEQDSNPTPGTPVAIKAIDITSASFTAKWKEAANAKSYEIDLAKDRYFNMMVKTVKSNTTSVGFLSVDDNTRYYYRVRAVNGDKVSANSNAIDVFTLPEPPMALAATSITNSGFTVNWNWAPSITSYLLYISTEDFPHDASKNLPAYNGKTVVSNTHVVTGLSSNTKYYYVLRSANGSNISANSNTISCTTLK